MYYDFIEESINICYFKTSAKWLFYSMVNGIIWRQGRRAKTNTIMILFTDRLGKKKTLSSKG